MKRPLFLDAEREERAYRAFGGIAIHWGPVELAIECHIVALRNKLNYGLSEDRRKWIIPFPLAFSKKVDELKQLLEARTGMEKPSAYLTPLLSECKRLHTIRVAVVHSICQGQSLNGKIEFDLSDQKNSRLIRRVSYKLEQLEKTVLDMIEMDRKLNRAKQPLVMMLYE